MNERYEALKAMHTLVLTMNDEEAYCEWICTVPDEATDEDLRDIAEDDDLFAEACAAYRYIAQTYADSGYYINKHVW